MSAYRVDFGKPIALFPLPGVSLLPHGAQPLHIFEPRYRQMVERCLASGNGDLERTDPIAMAVIDDRNGPETGEVSLCEAVCAGPESTSSIRQRMNGFTFGLGFGRSNQIFSRHHRFRMPAGQFGACLAIPAFDD